MLVLLFKKSTVHLFTMWLIQDINPAAPNWLYLGLGGYEAGLMTKEYIKKTIATEFVLSPLIFHPKLMSRNHH